MLFATISLLFSASLLLVKEFLKVGFVFLLFAVIELVTNTSEKLYIITLVCNGTNICESKPQYMSFNKDERISLYFSIPDMSEQDVYQFIKADPRFEVRDETLNVGRDCAEYSTNEQIGKTKSATNQPLSPNEGAIPCGYHVSLYPEGTLLMKDNVTHTSVQIYEEDLSDLPIENINLSKQWVDMTSQRFKSWLGDSASIRIIKNWGFIN